MALISLPPCSYDQLYSSDQTRFEYELTSDRIISQRGENPTILVVQSMASVTHLYTIQNHISAAESLGTLL